MLAAPCYPALLAICTLSLTQAAAAGLDDWPQWGGSSARNNVSPAKNLPVRWEVGQWDRKTGTWVNQDPSVLWVARLASESYGSYGSPVVAGSKVFCATNNEAGYLARYPPSVDLGCLLCFDRQTGRFLWQHSVPKLGNSNVDYPKVGLSACPLVEGDRLWLVTNRGEVVCLDTEGFLDGENDGPMRSEPATGPGHSDVIWSFDMMGRLGTVQRYMAHCSVTAAGRILLVGTSNGRDPRGRLPAPEAPSFIALDKQTGTLLWADNSPGENILDGQWSSPAFGVLGGVPQAIFGGGDGWLYSFLAAPTERGRPQLLWKFDCNPKQSVWEGRGPDQRNYIISTPVIAGGRVYVATGQDPESGEGQADLWCIDPTRRGDVSAELVVDRQGRPVPPRRLCAVDKEAGERTIPNPNSARLWHYRGRAPTGTPTQDAPFEDVLHRCLGMPVIHDGLLVLGDFAGLVHCLDAPSGRVLWTYDAMSAIWGSPLVADGKVYIGTQDGDVLVFELGPKMKLLAKNPMGQAVCSTPVAAGRALYIATATHLFAIGARPE
ncbi:MAG: outer membrane protein assembly factor BamB family protein [Thermoguttaceae bacterium]